MLNILMVGNTAFVGENLKKGLERQGHDVVLVTDIRWIDFLQKKYGQNYFDIVHIHSPNFKKIGLSWGHATRIVCHWHGSDLRHPMKGFPTQRFIKHVGDFHLYSTIDLRWWLRKIPENKKCLFRCPVDIDVFKPNGKDKKGNIVFRGGGRSIKNHRVHHNNMSDYLNNYETVDVFNADGLDDNLLSVLALEAVACGCKVNQFPKMNRKWVMDNASVESQTQRLLTIYNKLMEEN